MDYATKEDAHIFPWIKGMYEADVKKSSRNKIIDIGCKRGKWIKYLIDTIDEDRWIMIDAIPAFINDLSRFYTKAELLNVGISNVNEEKRRFIVDKTHLGHSGFTHHGKSHLNIIEVECKTLDYYNYDDIWFIKIDTEGHEYQILQGAEQTIIRNKPMIYFECYHKHFKKDLQPHTRKDLYKLLMDYGYDVRNVVTNYILNLDEFLHQTESDKTTEHNFIAMRKQ